jgi:hypothetical protein
LSRLFGAATKLFSNPALAQAPVRAMWRALLSGEVELSAPSVEGIIAAADYFQVSAPQSSFSFVSQNRHRNATTLL